VADPHPGGVSQHPDRDEDRLGVRMAHTDCGRTDFGVSSGAGASLVSFSRTKIQLEIPNVFAELFS